MAKSKKKMEQDSENIILTKGEKIFNVINVCILLTFSIICLYPFLYVLASSLSRGSAVDAGKVLLIPKGFNLESYKEILKDKQVWTSYANTLYYTVFGTIFSMLVSTPAAYALSKSRFKAKRIINMLLAFTMWFEVGFIPLYLNYTSLGVTDNRFMIVVSFGVQAFYIILMRNYFENIPKELEESSMIDGANDFTILLKIYMPLAKASMATVALYYAISRWNGYFWASILLKDRSKIPLQVYLKQMIIDNTIVSEFGSTIGGKMYSYNTLIYALVVISIIPILLLYPYIQKYFVKGIMVGGVKG